MLALLISLLIFLVFLYVIVYSMYRGIQKDTLEYDIKYLWNHYDTSFLKKPRKQ